MFKVIQLFALFLAVHLIIFAFSGVPLWAVSNEIQVILLVVIHFVTFAITLFSMAENKGFFHGHE